jgi:MFS family permease
MAPKDIDRQGQGAVAEAASPEVRAWITVGLLGTLYVLSFIDRTILALLVEPIRADLHLSDIQLGLLFGAVFAFFYAFSSIPLARLADRYSRKRIIIAGVIFWSSCTILSAFARNFTELALLRFGLAIGEAALTPAAFSLIADQFSMSRRMVASTLFSLSGMLGSASSYLVGGVLVAVLGDAIRDGVLPVWPVWKYVFVAVGMPGILVALLLAVVAHEPARGPRAHIAASQSSYLLHYLNSKRRLFIGLFLGAGAGQMICNAAIAWGPAYLQREFGYTLPASDIASVWRRPSARSRATSWSQCCSGR